MRLYAMISGLVTSQSSTRSFLSSAPASSTAVEITLSPRQIATKLSEILAEKEYIFAFKCIEDVQQHMQRNNIGMSGGYGNVKSSYEPDILLTIDVDDATHLDVVTNKFACKEESTGWIELEGYKLNRFVDMKIIAAEHRTHGELRVINFNDAPQNNCVIL